MSNNVKPVLERALELISDPEHWCQGTEAEDLDGDDIDYDCKYAVKFCMVGAVRRATHDLGVEYANALDVLAKFVPGVRERCQYHISCACRCSIPEFNDDENTTHEDVVLTFKRCIHALEELDEAR